jgi:hypothetical protein
MRAPGYGRGIAPIKGTVPASVTGKMPALLKDEALGQVRHGTDKRRPGKETAPPRLEGSLHSFELDEQAGIGGPFVHFDGGELVWIVESQVQDLFFGRAFSLMTKLTTREFPGAFLDAFTGTDSGNPPKRAVFAVLHEEAKSVGAFADKGLPLVPGSVGLRDLPKADQLLRVLNRSGRPTSPLLLGMGRTEQKAHPQACGKH